MSSNEALSLSEPQKCTEKKKSGKIYSKIFYFLFVVALTLAVNNIIIFNWYNNTKGKYKDAFLRVKTMTENNSNLSVLNEELTNDYLILKENYSGIIIQNEEAISRLKELEAQNIELKRKNEILTEDNIELQNSLKKAASVGIKPQNYTEFDEICIGDKNEKGEYVGKFFGTAYTPSKVECGNDKGITRSGTPIIPGVSVAIDNNYWPFGTIFYIKGLGYAIAMDTGNAIKGKYRFDFAVFDREFAKKLGTGYWDVFLVKMGNGKVEEITI